MAKRPAAEEEDPAWGYFDDALMYSCHVVAALRSGRADLLTARIGVQFAPCLGSGEQILAQGTFVLSEFRAPGNGVYSHSSGVFFATGRGGLALTGLFMGAQAVGNASRRSRAAADSVPRWLDVDRGSLTLSTHGFYLQSGLGYRTWGWDSITAADMVAPDRVHLDGQSTDGPVRWVLTSPWAPLLFALWCLARHSQHPRFLTNTWLPHGWWERAMAEGHRPAIGWAH